ncbi:MAG: hypothetical protein E6108_14295 [Clostridium perfringens]|uniref:hypothetical protein n=1 Tax=Enterococcus faecalis TaxID=1351 RepID=UPI00290926D8|nr:hypothetical protein [Clostridium perfringens]MDU5455748.1 hypothetical protein [Pseudescherichia vulneris]
MKLLDKLLHSILIILVVMSTLIVGLVFFIFKDDINIVYSILVDALVYKNDNIITVATVLIGIYFSLYSFVLGADSNSFFGKLKDKDDLKFLIRMINLGFFSSSLFTLLSLLNDLLFSLIHGFLVLILGILVIIMLGTLIQIIIYYTLIIRKDILSKFERMEDEKVKEHENEKLARDLRIFLNDYNEKKSQELYKKDK